MNNTLMRLSLMWRGVAGAVVCALLFGTLSVPGVALAALSAQTLNATNIGDTSATFQGTVGPSSSTGNISAWFEYGNTTSLGLSTGTVTLGSIGGDVSQSVSNLAEGDTIYFRIVAEPVGASSERVYGSVRSFVTGVSAGTDRETRFSISFSGVDIGKTAARVNGSVSKAPATMWVEWGRTTSFGQKSYSVTNNQPYQKQFISFTGLSPSTKYYVRLGATYNGVTRYSRIDDFTTRSASSADDDDDYFPGEPTSAYQPTVITRDHIAFGPTGVILQGRATNPKSGEMSLWFQWGTTQAVDQVTVPQRVSVNAYDFSATITGLTKGQRYYYRAVAANAEGNTLGSVLTFVAGEASPPGSSTLTAATGPLSYLSDTYATVTGTVQVGTKPALTYVKWGETEEMINKTNTVTLTRTGIAVAVSETISPLRPSTRYFYQAVAVEDGEVRGGIVRSFTTVATPLPTNGGGGGGGGTPPTTTGDGAKTTVTYRVENLTQESGMAEAMSADTGDKLRFAIQINNAGTSANKNITVTTEVPKEIAVTTIHNGGAQKGSVLTWEVPSLAAKTSTTLQFDATAGTANADLVHSLVASVVSSITNRASNEVHVILTRSPIGIAVEEDPSTVRRGNEVTYTFAVTNNASEDMLDGALAVSFAEGVAVTDEDDFSGGEPWKSEIGTLKEGKTAKKSITVMVPAGAPDKLITAIAFSYRFEGEETATVQQEHTTTVTGAAGTATSSWCGPSWWWWIITALLFIALVVSLLTRKLPGPKEVKTELPSINLPTYK